MRSWIECSYRDFKSDGWQWHKTRISDPNRAERLWLAMAVATLWMLTIGGESERLGLEIDQAPLPEHHISKTRSSVSSRSRQVSCFLQGLLSIIADLLNGKPICLSSWTPEPWPTSDSGFVPNSS